jgi:HD-GYP domain-containing protein (c-di-GMP phosphodiesterase class II)
LEELEEKKITKEQIDVFFETLQKNSALVGEWNDKLMESCEEQKWKDLAAKRSETLRQVYQNNEDICKNFFDSLPQRLTREELGILFELTYNLHVNGVYVVSVGLRLERILLPYFEELQDYGKIVFLNYAMGYANYLLFDRTLNYFGPSEWLQYFEKISTLEEHYCEIETEVFRGLFFSAYISLIQYSTVYPSIEGKTSEYYQGAHALWDREDVQKLDGNSPYLKAKIKAVDDQYLYILSIHPNLITNPDEYCNIASGLLNKIGRITVKSDPSGYYKIMENNVKRLKKQFSTEACVQAMADYIQKAIPPLNFDKNDAAHLVQLLNNELFTFNYTLSMLEELPPDKHVILDQAINRIRQDLMKVPYSFYSDNLDYLLYAFYESVEPYLKDNDEKWKLLTRLILCRQPMTYIHSRMVSKIASLICEATIETRPELFVGLEGCHDLASVKENREMLLSIIENCGLIHDVGKCRIALVINTQDRHLTEDEFGILKYHPLLGTKLLSKDPTFAPYTDVILGHHKSYDGAGYPTNFDNTSSPIRILIDLITIADCTDAATDVLGRNYNTGKSFKQLLEELAAGAGTKYNPYLIAVIQENAALQEKISKLTSVEGRSDLYRHTCSDILNMHQNTELKFI